MKDEEKISYFWQAANLDDLDKVKHYLENGIDVNATDRWSGFTALSGASLGGQLEIVKYLIDNGADINHVNKDGHTSLYLALDASHGEVAKYLVEKY